VELESKDVYLTKRLYWQVGPNSNSGVPFLVGLCAPSDATDHFIIKGEMIRPEIGERYRLWGEWKDDPKYNGKSFHFHSFEIVSQNTVSGLSEYFKRYVPELGKVRSVQIIEHFGPENCLKILRENPFRLKELPGIGTAIVEAIDRHFKEDLCGIDPAAYASVSDLLTTPGEPAPRRAISEIVKDFGSSAMTVIRNDPYLLLDYSGLGWKTVDRIAIKKLKYESKGLSRHRAAILEILQKFADDGDTIVDSVDLECKASKELNVNFSKEAIKSLIDDKSIEEFSIELKNGRKRKSYSLRELWDAEKEIAWRLRELIDSCPDSLPEIDTTGLEDEQIEACKFIRNHPVSLLIGPPGTGKTTSITKVIETLYRHGHKIIFTAPTGKAAKRASEVLNQWIPGNDIKVCTIHKALAPERFGSDLGVPEEHAKFGRERERFTFGHNEEFPMEMTDGITDEVSMEDVDLLLKYLRAVMPGTRLIFVGDENQLPSVGPGAVLRDMIAGGIPTFRLVKPRRNSGRIVKACHAVKDGRIYTPSKVLDLSIGENLFHMEIKGDERIAHEVVALHDCTDRNPMWDIQVISPQNDRLPIACENLNNLLSRKLNPKGFISEHQNKWDKFRVGDKIVRTKNGFVDLMVPAHGLSADDPYFAEELEDFSFDDAADFRWKGKDYYINKTYVVNGDIGQVLAVEKIYGKRYVIVEFKNPYRLCCLPAGESHIAPAYCITCHKAQGSGFPVVILPVSNTFHWNNYTQSGLWCREMFYTEISRGIDVVITVGEFSAIEAAIGRKTIDKRKTNLARFIKQEMGRETAA